MNTSVNYIEGLQEDLKDPVEAAAYLNAALEDGSVEGFLLALRDVVEARKGMELILSATEVPQLTDFLVFLEDIGLTFAVKPKENMS